MEKTHTLTGSQGLGLLITLCVLFVGLYLLSCWAINQGYLAPQQGIVSLVGILVIGIGIAGLAIHHNKRDGGGGGEVEVEVDKATEKLKN